LRFKEKVSSFASLMTARGASLSIYCYDNEGLGLHNRCRKASRTGKGLLFGVGSEMRPFRATLELGLPSRVYQHYALTLRWGASFPPSLLPLLTHLSITVIVAVPENSISEKETGN